MIKAEVITHEGNPGPNWLDRCRTLATPGKITVFILLAAVATVVLLADNKRHVGQANQVPANSSQQAATSSSTSLQVAPLINTSTPAESKAVPVQSVASAPSNSTGAAPTDSASKLGATTTPSLNTAKSASQATKTSPINSQLPSAAALTQTVQTTVQSAQDNAAKSVNDVKSKLGL